MIWCIFSYMNWVFHLPSTIIYNNCGKFSLLVYCSFIYFLLFFFLLQNKLLEYSLNATRQSTPNLIESSLDLKLDEFYRWDLLQMCNASSILSTIEYMHIYFTKRIATVMVVEPLNWCLIPCIHPLKRELLKEDKF